jgi:hypothetical protein
MTSDNRLSFMERRELLRWAGAAGLLAVPGVLAGCSGGGMPMIGGNSSGSDPMMRGGMTDGSMMADMQVIMDLLNNHQTITRTVDDVEGGIVSRTTSSDTRIADLIGSHVAAMKARIEQDHPIRQGDPLFAELFRHHGDIRIRIEGLPDGVQVTETSANPQVTLLIRQHARMAVSQFVTQGMTRAMRPPALPDGYRG